VTILEWSLLPHLRMFDSNALDALHRASSLELYFLSTSINRILADPRRVLDISRHLHTGQTVRFLDTDRSKSTPVMTPGVIFERQREYAVLQAEDGRLLKVPYVAIEVPTGSQAAAPAATAQPAAPRRPTRADFRKGDRVTFED